MKFGLLTQWYEPEPGPATLPAVLARGLVERGHTVQVVTGFPNYPTGKLFDGYRLKRRQDERVDGVDIRRVALYPSHDDSSVRRVLNYGSFAASSAVAGLDVLSDADALWVNYSPITIALPMLLAQRRWRTPAVVHVLDLWPDTLTASGFGGGLVGRRVDTLLHRWCSAMYDAAHTVAYISPGVGKVLSHRDVPDSKLAYAPMWADESTFAPRPTPNSRGWGLAPDDVALVYAGTLGGAQDLDTLIRASARVEDDRFKCLIAGSGTREDALRALAADVGATNVRFLGRLPKAEMGPLMEAGDVHYVGLNDHPLARITMPSKVQATMASARPIVGALLGDAADVVRTTGSGWVIEPGDVDGLTALIRQCLVLQRDGLRKVGEAARQAYEGEFSVRAGVDRIERFLTDAAAAGGPSA